MARNGSWSLKVAMVLGVAALVWAGVASIAVSSLESRLNGQTSAPAPSTLVTAR